MEVRTFELGFGRFIERFSEQIKDDFLEDAFDKRGLLANYEGGKKLLEELADGICHEFCKTIDRNTPVDAIADQYIKLGAKCCDTGISYSDMVQVFVLLKRHIWVFFQDSNFAGQPFDVRSIVALNNRTALFFDRAICFFLMGYEKSNCQRHSEADKLYESFLKMLRRDLGVIKGPIESDRPEHL